MSTPETPLTASQARVLRAISDLTDEKGYAPTVREVGARAGLSSPSSTHRHIRALEEMDLLRRAGKRARAMTVRNRGAGCDA